ncbi:MULTISPECIES: TadE/TadG family type IV pilus assembly protein [unclassified Bradyrhizobium]|uniref:TadE/TadG family type IV pilus assembly protein n=1 Tax=unclassified Bradyrhizobium TaxID=2631580 RepID=UPI002011FD23|nr:MULTISPECIES: TadE/TadG family type IV pilus assembly protein [unclassified Bradyrhizobium]
MHRFRRFRACTQGVSAVEFALIAPIFLMLVFGIITYGGYLAVMYGVQQLTAAAARSSIAGLSDTERSNLATTYVNSNVNSYPLLAASNVTVNAAASPSNANVFVVTVNYNASGLFIYSLPKFVPTPPTTVVSSAAIPRGGF